MDIMLEDDDINLTDEQTKLVPNKEFLASLFARVKPIVRTGQIRLFFYWWFLLMFAGLLCIRYNLC